MTEQTRIFKSYKSRDLNLVLTCELALGNSIIESSDSWPSSQTFWLNNAFSLNYIHYYNSLNFRILNDSHYWFEELLDSGSNEMLLTSFKGIDSQSLLSTSTSKIRTWRPCGLRPGEKCILTNGNDSTIGFRSPERVMTFIDESYSPYDSNTVYRFIECQSLEEYVVSIHDDNQIGIDQYIRFNHK